MTDCIFNIEPDGRWHVPVADDGSWRAGVYKPEFTSPDDITILEKHSCPELFVCLNGTMGLILGSGTGEKLMILNPNQAVMVTDFHNGYAIDSAGFFMVVERTSFSTEYIDRKSLEVIERRSVG